ncbi:bpX6 domain-containing protein, partial [Kitasatospora sp. NPDC093558]|uniref:bpX6 domain-containing protein n=1 Tax=Kitasatospora sp. NPDC093558 TaxID=3155201 RepID=UPI0034158006
MSPVIHAAGFVLNVPVIGAAEAADRVLAAWSPGARLRELPDGRWLFTLAEPKTVHVDAAPGEPVRAIGGGLVAVSARGDESCATGELVLLAGNVIERHILNSLPELNPADWLDLSGLTLHRLGAVGAPVVTEPVREDAPQAPAVDLRAAARIPGLTDRARRRTAPGRDRPKETRAGAVAVFVVAVISAVIFAVAFSGLIARAGFDLGAFLLALGSAAAVILAFVLNDRRRARAAGATHWTAGRGAAKPRATQGMAGRGAAKPRGARRTPSTSTALHRRHLRYVRDLTRAFQQRRWEDALRDAIRLTAAGSREQPVWFGRRLPRRFTGALKPTPRPADGPLVASPLSGPTVHQYLTGLYREAARALEDEGRIDEAAFVHADLLNAPAEAVAVLARHDRAAQAAELAE